MCVLWGGSGTGRGQGGVPKFPIATLIRYLMGTVNTTAVLGGEVCVFTGCQSAYHVHVAFQSVPLGTLGRRPSDFCDVSSHRHLITSTQPPEGPLICMALLWCLLKSVCPHPVIYGHSTAVCVHNHTYTHITENY